MLLTFLFPLAAVAAISTQTSDLLKGCEVARKIGAELQEELRDISGQVLMMRYQCSLRDRRLCDTLQPIGFNVVFSVKDVSVAVFNPPQASEEILPQEQLPKLEIILQYARQLLIPLHNNQ